MKEWEKKEKTILKKRRLDQTLHKRLMEVQLEIRSIKQNLLEWNKHDKVNEALLMLQDGITHLQWKDRLDGKVTVQSFNSGAPQQESISKWTSMKNGLLKTFVLNWWSILSTRLMVVGCY